jgi:hypothetical protein
VQRGAEMVGRLRSWWQQIKQHPFRWAIIIGARLLGIGLIVAFIGGYFFNWDWTGLGSYTAPTKDINFQRGKTLWDWMQLLIIPVMLAIAGFWLNQIQKSREQRTTQQQAELEFELTRDNQRENLLQAYMDNMSELLLEKKLRESSQGEEVRKIARVRTLAVLHSLDRRRKRRVLQFLYELSLISKDNLIVGLTGADLQDADLHIAILKKAALKRTYLSKADLRGANLSEADLSGADLSEANLKDAIGITVEELEKQAKSLKGATMPNGDIHP